MINLLSGEVLKDIIEIFIWLMTVGAFSWSTFLAFKRRTNIKIAIFFLVLATVVGVLTWKSLYNLGINLVMGLFPEKPEIDCDVLAADSDDVFLPAGIKGLPQVVDPAAAVLACQAALKTKDDPRIHYQLGRSAEALAKIQGAQGNEPGQRDNLNLAADEYQKAEERKYAPAVRRIAETYYVNKKFFEAKEEFEAAKDGSYGAMCWIGGFIFDGWVVNGKKLYDQNEVLGREMLINSSKGSGKIPCLHPDINNSKN